MTKTQKTQTMKKNKSQNPQIVIYQAKNGSIDLKGDYKKETLYANLNQIAKIYGRDKSVISRHIKNIFKSGELQEKSVVAKIATTAADDKTYKVDYYNLDMLISIGYRVDSKEATKFRIWATRNLKQYITKGFTIDRQKIAKNYQEFSTILQDLKIILPKSQEKIENSSLVELISNYAKTWISLDAYDKNSLPIKGKSKSELKIKFNELNQDLQKFKKELIKEKQASELFAREKTKNALEAIFYNIFASFDGRDLYKTHEEKAAHLFYFVIKNHPFVDGHKRSASFSFIWFLRKVKLLKSNLNAESLTLLTILIAESDPKNKDKMIGLILNILN